ncbi:hypothetical protein MMC27_008759 [Xylographa pallens]|nr:hypothetical protein [Xylographa pallens]
MQRQEEGLDPMPSIEWSNIDDYDERRKVQNRMAQRKYRERMRLRSGMSKDYELEQVITSGVADNTSAQQSSSLSGRTVPSTGTGDTSTVPWRQQAPGPQDQMDCATSDPLLSFPGSDKPPLSTVSYPSMDFGNYSTSSDPLWWQQCYSSSSVDASLGRQYPQSDPTAFGHLMTPAIPEYQIGLDEHGHRPQPQTPISNSLSSPSRPTNQSHSRITGSPLGSQVSEPQPPQRDSERHGGVGEEISKTARSPTRRSQLFNKSRKNLLMYGRGLKDGSTESRARQFNIETRIKDTKAQSESQKKMMRFACQQVRKEAVASFEKQKARLRSKAGRLIDRVAETYEYGVCLEIFSRDVEFDEHLQATKIYFASLEKTSGEVFGTNEDLMNELENPVESESSYSSSNYSDDNEWFFPGPAGPTLITSSSSHSAENCHREGIIMGAHAADYSYSNLSPEAFSNTPIKTPFVMVITQFIDVAYERRLALIVDQARLAIIRRPRNGSATAYEVCKWAALRIKFNFHHIPYLEGM